MTQARSWDTGREVSWKKLGRGDTLAFDHAAADGGGLGGSIAFSLTESKL